MQHCAACSERSSCREICPPIERFLRKDTRYQKERIITQDYLDTLALEAWKNGLISINGNEHLLLPADDPRLQRVQETIEILTNKQRQIFDLWMEGWTHARIAEAMGTSRPNISKVWKQIRIKVTKSLV
jgi:DNA-binding CsgD family transcriptional regulator